MELESLTDFDAIREKESQLKQRELEHAAKVMMCVTVLT